jgi:hypothetical protein
MDMWVFQVRLSRLHEPELVDNKSIAPPEKALLPGHILRFMYVFIYTNCNFGLTVVLSQFVDLHIQ